MSQPVLALMLNVLLAWPAAATTWTETFSSRANFDLSASSPAAVWNNGRGSVHPSLQLVGYNTSGAPIPILIGDGSDGVFDPSTYASFSQGGDVSGNKIRLNTDTHPQLQVTDFLLAAGWTLEPVGSQPLIIRSQGNIIIRGTINCAGDPGGNASGLTPGAGGGARCGGHPGGAGGAQSGDGTSGSNATGGVTGGRLGHFTSDPAMGGGGGGGWNSSTSADNGANATLPTYGAAGVTVDNALFTTVDGGAGGGGGSGSSTAAGAGGGAGGGVVLIYAFGQFDLGTAPTSTTGFIFVNGGDGGTSNTTGGAGGGGGGGSLQIFVGGDMNLYNTNADGAAQALGGNNALSAVGAAGGFGRTWLSSMAYHSAGGAYYQPAEQDPPITSGDWARFVITTQYIVTKSIDLGGTDAQITGATLTPASADFALEYEGSNDDFVADFTGWSVSANAVAGKRYLRLRVVVQAASPTTISELDEISLVYEPGSAAQTNEFKFKAAGCGRVHNGRHDPPWAFLLACGAGLAVLIRLRQRARRSELQPY